MQSICVTDVWLATSKAPAFDLLKAMSKIRKPHLTPQK